MFFNIFYCKDKYWLTYPHQTFPFLNTDFSQMICLSEVEELQLLGSGDRSTEDK